MNQEEYNPFRIMDYDGPETFCDREEEVERLHSSIKNDRPQVLFSKRRMGKTGLIKHLYHQLSNDYYTTYVEMLNTNSDAEFISELIKACILHLDRQKKNFFSDMVQVFGKYRPRVSVDPLTGTPSLELNLVDNTEANHSLDTLFQVLAQEKKKVLIAIDEFQQIANYSEKTRLDATLRKYMQQSTHYQFLLAGSQRHLLLDLFNNPKKPMYRMLDQIQLHEIGYDPYFQFIKRHFEEADKSISDAIIHEILTWTKRHTYYTQVLCNKLYAESYNIDERILAIVKERILKEYEMNFLAYRNLLTKNQFQTLTGIAREGSVTTVRSKEFVGKYGVASSTAQQSLNFLVDKEMVYEDLTQEGSVYSVYDLFLEKWLVR